MTPLQIRRNAKRKAAAMKQVVTLKSKREKTLLITPPDDVKKIVDNFKFPSGKTFRAVPTRNKGTDAKGASSADKIACRGKQKCKGSSVRPSGWYSKSQLAG
ncbi:hypothetical protein [Escherichia phage PJNS034]